MIAKLKGILDETGADWAVIDVQGVGYLVHCSAKTLAALGEAGEACTVFTDLRISWHTFEMDGKVKYDVDGPYARGRTAQQILWDEKEREDFVRRHDYGVTRFGWADLWGSRRAKLQARCRREMEVTIRRVGPTAWAIGLDETRAALLRAS